MPANSSKESTKAAAEPRYTVHVIAFPKTQSVRIVPSNPPENTTDTVDVEFHFPIERDVFISVSATNVPYKDRSYVIDNTSLTNIADDLLQKLNAYGKLTGKDGLTEMTSKAILITASGKDDSPKKTAFNSLTVRCFLFSTRPAAASKQAASAPKVSVSDRTGVSIVTQSPAATTSAAASRERRGSATFSRCGPAHGAGASRRRNCQGGCCTAPPSEQRRHAEVANCQSAPGGKLRALDLSHATDAIGTACTSGWKGKARIAAAPPPFCSFARARPVLTGG